MTEPVEGASSGEAGTASLPALVARLGEDVLSLIDSKLSLLRIEVEEDVRAYGRGLFAIGVAGVVAAVGFALVNVALAFVVAGLLRDTGLSPPLQHGLAFGATGFVYLLIGITIALRARSRLAAHDPKPGRSLAELARDREWLQKGSR
jgi:uncharacterized membrane protein YqjE